MHAILTGDADDEGFGEAIQAVEASSGSPPRPDSNGSEMEEDEVKGKKGKKSSSLAGSSLVKATPKAALRARPMDSRLNKGQIKAKQVDEPNGGYREAVEKILAEIPRGARRYARNSLRVNLDKDAYKCLAFPQWLNGAVAIALLSLLDPSPNTQVFFIDTVTDPETGLLVKDKPNTIPIDGKVTTAIFAHCSNEHWVAIAMDMSAEDGPYYASCYCSFGKLLDEDVMDFYCELVERSLRSTGAFSDKFTGEWIYENGSCARQPEGDSNSCGIYTLYNIARLVDGLVPSSDDELDPERQRWLFARQISEYVTTHDPVSAPSNSPLLCPIDTLSLTNYPTSTKGKGNYAKGKGKKTLEEDNQSPAETDLLIGDAMDVDEPMDKDSEASVFPASPTSPSLMTVKGRKDRLIMGLARKGRGVKRSEATRSDEDAMEVETVSKRRKQSSTATPGPTTASVPTTTDQTPPRATTQGFATINQPVLPSLTGLAGNPIQRGTRSLALSRIRLTQPSPQFSSSTSGTIESNHSKVGPVEREAIFRAMDQHVLTAKACCSLRDLLVWQFKSRMSGDKPESSQNPLSLLQIGSLNPIAVTAATLKEASQRVYQDIGQSLKAELLRRYHLAIFVRQFEQRKKVLEDYYSQHRVPGVKLATLINDALLKETVFANFKVIQKMLYRGSIWLGLAERFGYPFLALVDLSVTRAQ